MAKRQKEYDIPGAHEPCLQFIRDLWEISETLHTRTYVWGRMVVDNLSHEFLREHHDIDAFTLNMLKHKRQMMDMLSNRGYSTSYLEEYDMLKIKKGEVHAGLNRLEVDNGTAKWRHVGDQGTIGFPFGWLDSTPRQFLGVSVYTSGPKFEYAIKTNVHLLSPEWRLRSKDRYAIRFLNKHLKESKVPSMDFLRDRSTETSNNRSVSTTQRSCGFL